MTFKKFDFFLSLFIVISMVWQAESTVCFLAFLIYFLGSFFFLLSFNFFSFLLLWPLNLQLFLLLSGVILLFPVILFLSLRFFVFFFVMGRLQIIGGLVFLVFWGR